MKSCCCCVVSFLCVFTVVLLIVFVLKECVGLDVSVSVAKASETLSLCALCSLRSHWP